MCEVSGDIKFCTCTQGDLPEYNIWKLGNKKEVGYVGEVLFDFGAPNEYHVNQKIFEDRLNQKDCFDFDYSPSENDTMQIKLKADHPYIYYKFIFRKGRWHYQLPQHDSSFSFETGPVTRAGKVERL